MENSQLNGPKLPINISMVEDKAFYGLKKEDIGNHILLSIGLRSKESINTQTNKTIKPLWVDFNDVGKVRSLKNKETFPPTAIEHYENEIVTNKRQFFVITEKIQTFIGSQKIHLDGNYMLEDLIRNCKEEFFDYEMYIDGFETKIQNNGILSDGSEWITTKWVRGKSTPHGTHGSIGMMCLKMVGVNGIDLTNPSNFGKFTDEQLSAIAGKYKEGGLAEESCKIIPKSNGNGCEMI